MDPDAQTIIETASALAAERRSTNVDQLHLLYALTQPEDGAAEKLLARYGGSAAKLNAQIERGL
jgi:ATP-dependent Clp protease ATP-binding subunit ClpA